MYNSVTCGLVRGLTHSLAIYGMIVSSLEVDLGYNNASQIKRELLSTPVHYYADVIIIIDNKGTVNKSRGSATFTIMAASKMI